MNATRETGDARTHGRSWGMRHASHARPRDILAPQACMTISVTCLNEAWQSWGWITTRFQIPSSTSRLAAAQTDARGTASYGRAKALITAALDRARSNASLCQGVLAVLLEACEVPFGRCGFTSDLCPMAFPRGRVWPSSCRLPGRSSSLRCGRSAWTCGVAGGKVAAIGE
jgi:hypothetical protein